MKARQDFVIYLDKNSHSVSHVSGESMDGKVRLDIRKGEDVPDNIVYDLLRSNPDFLQIEYESGQYKLTDDERKKYNFPVGVIKIVNKPIVSPRKYSQDSLTRISNEKGVGELKRIAEEEFGMTHVRASHNLIVKILQKQEESRR